MAERDDTADAPPAGEEIHLPNPSILPVLNAVGVALAIVGITISLLLVIGGAVLFLGTAIVWIRDARRELDELPLEHGSGH